MTGPIIRQGSENNDGTPPTSKEQIEGYISTLKSLVKEYNSWGDVSLIRLNFDEDKDTIERRLIVTGQEVGDADLKRPFKETSKTPLTWRIIEFAGLEYRIIWGDVSLIRLNFDEDKDTIERRLIMTGQEVGDADLKRPFKETSKTPLTWRIIEFAGLEYRMLTNIKVYDRTTNPKDHLNRFASVTNSGNGMVHANMVSYVPANFRWKCKRLVQTPPCIKH
ncbi:hypothetical protein Tco_1287088 [Tanacetum coccineum]